jgi:hypothetical protein
MRRLKRLGERAKASIAMEDAHYANVKGLNPMEMQLHSDEQLLSCKYREHGLSLSKCSDLQSEQADKMDKHG